MGFIETFSIPKEDVSLIRAYLSACQKQGRGRSKVVVSALKKLIEAEGYNYQPQDQQREQQKG